MDCEGKPAQCFTRRKRSSSGLDDADGSTVTRLSSDGGNDDPAWSARDRIAYVHVAGGEEHDGLYHDTHTDPTPPEVLDLVRELCARHRPPALILERDGRYPPAAVFFCTGCANPRQAKRRREFRAR